MSQVIRTEWFWNTDRICKAVCEATGARSVAIFRSSGLGCNATIDGKEVRLRDGMSFEALRRALLAA